MEVPIQVPIRAGVGATQGQLDPTKSLLIRLLRPIRLPPERPWERLLSVKDRGGVREVLAASVVDAVENRGLMTP
jgi:hypothetical protein